MESTATSSDCIESFITRWESSGGAERANAQLFLSELCDLLGLPKPDPAQPENALNRYTFERAVTRINPDGTSTTAFIDLYKAGHFVLETKQGVAETHSAPDPVAASSSSKTPTTTKKAGHGKRGTPAWDTALERAYNQARRYIRELPPSEGRPPFLIVCDVGHVLELYSEFTCTGGVYVRFPDPKSHRIYLEDPRRPDIRERLRAVWLAPLDLDPARHAAAVTRDIATRLAQLARSMEEDGHHPESTAIFLQRCLFTMFAEDIGLLPKNGFYELLEKCVTHPAGFTSLVSGLWHDMATGTDFSVALMQKIAHFNGGLFENPTAPALKPAQIQLLLDAASADWSAVEPAIFGTLLERALDSRERHKLGAHYTPRSYVERLVKPVLADPLREEWDAVKTAAASHHQSGDDKAALAEIRAFHQRLCRLRILDPACGSGNFLYVALEHLKRLEGEVLELLAALGDTTLTFEMAEFKVRPEQFLGIELNERASAIAQLVLWIGYFQWHLRTTGKADTNDRPLLPKSKSIECRDAVLAYDERIPRRDPADPTGVKYLTMWDGRSTKPHPVTGKEVPDEAAQIMVFDYVNPRRAEWPQADFIVGNPPFIGASRMRDALGDGYTEALRQAWKGDVPESADFVMFWWCKAAAEVVQGRCQRFGFITTNSIHQTFNRRVIEPFLCDAKNPLHLAYAIPDHPWVDSAQGAAVRISMTVGAPGSGSGVLEKVVSEHTREDGENEVVLESRKGMIAANLQVGADLTNCHGLTANSGLSNRGFCLFGAGFIIPAEVAKDLLKPSNPSAQKVIWKYRNGKDLTTRPRDVMVIDAFPFTIDDLQSEHPGVYQHLLIHVKPERDHNARESRRKLWWAFGEPNKLLRSQLEGLPRYIATVETSKHRFFVFLDKDILPDNKLIAIGTDDSALLASLSSTVHVIWSLACGSWLGVGNDSVYVKTRCFETFPFPAFGNSTDGKFASAPPAQCSRTRERLDQSASPADQKLTLSATAPQNPSTNDALSRLRDLGERLDAHRKARQAAHSDLTLTGMYNVLTQLRLGVPLSAKEKAIHDAGLVTILKQLHDDIDAAVLEAYGWTDLADTLPLADRLARPGAEAEALEQEILTRLVALNRERAAEEANGHIRWLRPDFQNPVAVETRQTALTLQPSTKSEEPRTVSEKLPWPAELPARVALIKALLATVPAEPEQLAKHFAGSATPKRKSEISAILETLRLLGQI